MRQNNLELRKRLMDRESAWGLLTEYTRSGDRRKNLRWLLRLTVVLMVLLAASLCQQAPAADEPTALLDRLVGHWVLSGRLGRKQTTHDIEGEWVLKREYL